MIIERKLDSLQRCITRIASKCPPQPEALLNDIDLQDIVILNLSRAIQLCVNIGLHCLSAQNLPQSKTHFYPPAPIRLQPDIVARWHL